MKERIMKLLAYPREMISDQIYADQCPHSGFYDESDGQCRRCEVDPECRWLASNDDFQALADKPATELVGPLAFAVDFVNIQIAHWGHDPAHCTCEACVWVRDASQLRDEVSPGGD